MSSISDMTIIGSILAIFVLLGVFLPFIQAEFDAPEYSNVLGEGADGTAINFDSDSSVSAFSIFFSVLGMFFSTFGLMPLWLDAMFIIIRLIFWLTLLNIELRYFKFDFVKLAYVLFC